MAATVAASAIVHARLQSDVFAPGAIVAGRYRLVALLGRGGMGEVYRAEDLTLDQPVALKFLPEGEMASDARLSRFHNELRIARQVSHRNVCRVYDLGDANGRRFLTMEYVDGEDLASLLRRIGRVPHDKAVEIARQLCAGVAAAHDRGVVHRDLKPANVMIDGEGNVRVTDFGIATAKDAVDQGFAGTPQYMAPEQIAGQPASIKSDIYALGLVLFELFTGRRAVESKTLVELETFYRSGTVTTPSSIVRDVDPVVERTIMRCLERDPVRRPASALVVAASLPGADPLAAALAAGETPSPELLAAAGEAEALGARWAVASVAVVLAGIVAFAGLTQDLSLAGRAPLPEPKDVLVDRAEAVVAAVGADPAFGDRASDFFLDEDYVRWVQQTRSTPDRWDVLSTGRPSAVLFWYRTSPQPMRPQAEVWVSREDPPPVVTDMRTVILDTAGRLVAYRSVPPQVDSTDAPANAPAWDPLFAAAGLSMSDFDPVTPEWLPREYADARAAWEGPLPTQPDLRLRVEAASYRNQPVSFEVIGPWTRPTRLAPVQPQPIDQALQAIAFVVILALLLFALVVARRNVQDNRADRRGALRLVWYVLGAGFVSWVIGAHHVLDANALLDSFFRSFGPLLLFGAILWVIYIAVEPYVRRFWPDSLLGWSRLLAGHVRDPRVGRDALIGLLFGVALAFGDVVRVTLLPWLGSPAPRPPFGLDIEMLSAGVWQAANWLTASLSDTMEALFTVLLIVVLRLLLRRNWLVIPVMVLILGLTSARYMGSSTAWMTLFPLFSGAVLTFVVMRHGLLSLVVTRFVWGLLLAGPMTLDVGHWSATASNATILLLGAMAVFAFYAARAGQPVFGGAAARQALGPT
jgi:serine/threonine-protein kinase